MASLLIDTEHAKARSHFVVSRAIRTAHAEAVLGLSGKPRIRKVLIPGWASTPRLIAFALEARRRGADSPTVIYLDVSVAAVMDRVTEALAAK